MEYKKYLDLWLSGLIEEIQFWDDYMESGGGDYPANFSWTTNAEKAFPFEDEIGNMEECKFIDVGSGPFSRCGHITEKCRLSFTAVDPLGRLYELFKKRYSLENGIRVKTGFVEFLDRQFAKNTFDIVHMSNSLDHAFDPVFGIYELLYICKIGGKVILRHAENEAERSTYAGLHQWNLSLHMQEGEFWIWNKNTKVNVSEVFSPYAEIQCVSDIQERESSSKGWTYNKVVLTKQNEVSIPENSYYDSMLMEVYDRLLSCVDERYETSSKKSITRKRRRILDRLKQENYFAKKLLGRGISECTLYGFGDIGRGLCEELGGQGLDVLTIVDKGEVSCGESRSVLPEQWMYRGENVIVTTPFYYDEIKQDLLRRGVPSTKIIGVEELLEEY